ncbi:MAG TPA: two-component regulator propeller domain-containing protein [Bacteroidia bacterium]|nr:two-component regulator propeller domain-containing protein [Bacteroidia bacterium]
MKKIILLLFLLHCAFNTLAEERLASALRFGRISVDRGLSQSTVFCSYQDSQGFLWFGTDDGLNKYDGYTFEVYKFDPTDARTLSNNSIHAIFEDSKRNLWIGTDNGLNLYNPKNGSFRRFQNIPNDPSSVSSNIISSIAEDKDSVVWIGTNNGLNALDTKNFTFSATFSNKANISTLSSSIISSLLVDRSGTVWVGTASNGLNAFDPKTKKSTRYVHEPANKNSLSENEITTLSLDRSGNLWIGTVNGGINVLTIASRQFTHYTTENGLSSNSIFSIHEDQEGIFWIGTLGGGLDALDRSTGKIVNYKRDPRDMESLSNNKVWSIFEDNASTLWFTTSDGISYFNRTIGKFITHKVSEGDGGDANNSVFAVHEDRDGNIWVGVLGGGLNVFSRTEEKFVNDRFPALNNPILRFNNIFALEEDRNGVLWIGTSDGLISYDRKSGTVEQFRNNRSDKSSLSNNYVRCIKEDKSGNLWIGTHGGGLNAFNPTSKKFKVYRNIPADASSLSADVVLSVCEDKDGRIWAGTYGGGLNRLDPVTGKFNAYHYDPNDPKTISSNFIHSIFQDQGGKLWVGTYGGGLNLLEPTTQTFRHYTENNGLPNNVVNGILSDGGGNLWISTNNGVCKILPGKQGSSDVTTTRSYNLQDGLQNKFNENACFIGNGGWIYFGGSNGLNAFHPDSIHDNTAIPPVVITRFYLFEKPARMDTLISSEHKLELNYKQNFFSFEFAALNYVLPEKNRYYIMMEGLDKEWIYRDNKRIAAYTNIDPGHYVFRVKACNNDGVWNNEGIAIEITIKPPFYRTWWFTGLSALAITLLIFVYIRIRTNTLVKQNIVLEDKVNLRTSELQDKNIELTKTMDNLRSTQTQLIQSEKMASLGQLTAGIAHEIQNPLNFVNNFSELSVELLNEFETAQGPEQKEIVGDLKQNMEKIVFHGKRADSIVKGMLQHSRASAVEKQATDINKLVEEYFSLAYHGMKANDPAFNCTMEKKLDRTIPAIKIIPQDISRVILNIFNNAFYAVNERKKEGEKNYQPTVSITTQWTGNKAVIVIHDNGKGIVKEIRDKIFNPFFTTKPTGQGTGLGLSISYDIIVKGHGGEIKVDSVPGEYSEFTVLLPVNA